MGTITEKTVEKYLVDYVRKKGGRAYKFKSPARRNVPDRLCILPGGLFIFVECKSPGKQLTKAQAREAIRLKEMGALVFVTDGHETSKGIVDHVLDIANAKPSESS